MAKGKVRVLIVDDSALVREILRQGLEEDPEIEVVGTARDAYEARDLLVLRRPDVITLDVEMPRMDGVTFLRRYMAVMPTPTVMVSSLTERGKRITLEALEAGAVDIVTKPKVGVAEGLKNMMAELREKVKQAAKVDVSRFRQARVPVKPVSSILHETTDRVVLIGASTGGTEALARILPAFPRDFPGILIVQHIPAGFSRSFAERLDKLSRIEVREAEGGERVRPGLALLAPGTHFHMEVYRSGGEYRVRLVEGEKVNGHRPSVDVLFESAAKHCGANAIGVLLTGMGRDGAKGLLAMRRSGARTLAQDESTSVVFGMPKAAWELGAAEELVPLHDIPSKLAEILKGNLLERHLDKTLFERQKIATRR